MMINGQKLYFTRTSSHSDKVEGFKKRFERELAKKEDLTFDAEAQQFMLLHCKDLVKFMKVKEVLLMIIEYDNHYWVHSNHINNPDLQEKLGTI